MVALLVVLLAGPHLLAVLSALSLPRSVALCLLALLALHLAVLLVALLPLLMGLSVLVLLLSLLVLLALLALLAVLLSLALLAIVRLSVVPVGSGVLVVMHDESRVRYPCDWWGPSPQIDRTPFSTGRSSVRGLALAYRPSRLQRAQRQPALAE